MIFLLLLFFASPLLAQEDVAARYFEAKEYAKALDQYEGLLKQPLTPWQRSVVSYNIGRVLLASGHYEEAIQQWLSIPLGRDPFPLLKRRIDTNIAVAKLMQVEAMKLQTTPDFEKAAFLLHEALAYTERAAKQECALQKIEGASTCKPPKDLEVLKSKIQEQFQQGRIRWQQQNLLDAYTLALLEDPLQEATLRALLQKQPTEDLELSLKALSMGNELLARFHLQKARFQIILNSVKRGTSALHILEEAIELQHEATVLNRLVERSEKPDPIMIEGAKKAQEATVAIAATFKPAVFQEQEREFTQPGPLEERCQVEPWLEVFPLFDAGFDFAQEGSLASQEEALQKWTRAIQLLKKPKGPFKGKCTASFETPPSEEGQKQPQPIPMNQVLKNIQKIEEEEHVTPKAAAAPQGEKPW